MFEFVNKQFSKPTSIFGLNLWFLIPLIAGALTLLILLLICLTSYRCRIRRKSKPPKLSAPDQPREVQIKVEKAEHGVFLVSSGRMPSSGESKASGGGGPGPEEAFHLGKDGWNDA